MRSLLRMLLLLLVLMLLLLILLLMLLLLLLLLLILLLLLMTLQLCKFFWRIVCSFWTSFCFSTPSHVCVLLFLFFWLIAGVTLQSLKWHFSILMILCLLFLVFVEDCLRHLFSKLPIGLSTIFCFSLLIGPSKTSEDQLEYSMTTDLREKSYLFH